MNKIITIIWAFVIWSPTESSILGQTPSNSTVTRPSPIKSLRLDKALLTLPCPPTQTCPESSPPSNFLVNVDTELLSKEKNITVVYSVTGGKIIGQGNKVVWDLAKTSPGSYTIRAQPFRRGKPVPGSKSETVDIVNNICICDCFCPFIEINTTRPTIAVGDSVVVVASITGGSQERPLTLNWTTTNGQITSGQGTYSIVVKIPPDTIATEVVVTLTVGGLYEPCACPTSRTKTIRLKY